MSTAAQMAAELADKVFGFGSKVATGEMTQSELDATGRDEWPLHYAIADALGGTVKPFDQYQGPYVLIGEDIRQGREPYQVAPRGLGVVRLWISSDDGVGGVVYNEENERQSEPFLLNGPQAENDAIAAAEEVLGTGAPQDKMTPEDISGKESSATAPKTHPAPLLSRMGSPLDGKTASMLGKYDHPSSNPKLQQVVGDPLDQPISAFVQFYPNTGLMQTPNPLSPIEGDAAFFAYMIPGAVFQSHDGQQWVIDDYNAGAYGVELYNRWYPRLRAFVNVSDVRRSIHSWVEPIQVVVPPPPPGVTYQGQPVRIVEN